MKSSLGLAVFLAFALSAQPAVAQTQSPAGTNPPVSSPPPPTAPMPKRAEPANPPADVSPAPPEPKPEPKGRWGPIDQYQKNTRCYVAGRYVPSPPMCPE
jgi:hypothetical protein